MEVPTYRRAPNFSIPPNGPLKLGTIVEDLQQLHPINQFNQVEIPAGSTYHNKEKGFATTLEKIREHEFGAVARIFGIEGLGGEASTGVQRNVETAIYTRELETLYFYPSTKYIAQALALEEVKTYMETTRKKFPVYLITGLKIAHGASWSTSRDGGFRATVEATIPEPFTAIVDVGPKISSTTSSKKTSSVEYADSFILGYRATKIWYKWYNKDEMKSQPYLTGATMAGDEGGPIVQQDGEYQMTPDIGIEAENEDIVWIGNHIDGIEPSRWIIPRHK